MILRKEYSQIKGKSGFRVFEILGDNLFCTFAFENDCQTVWKREFLKEKYTIKSLNGRTNRMVRLH